jgi:hypothetical protein
MNACNHENVQIKELQRTRYDLTNHVNVDIPNTYLHIEECTDCGEIREETFFIEPQTTIVKNQSLYNRHQYKVAQTYYTDAGSLVERSVTGDWYWNGQKMSMEQLQTRLQKTGDNIGRQNVSDSYKELCIQAKYKSLQIRYGKDELHERARDFYR